ncbi:MAG: HNH endonuclease [Cellvibrionales bacterium]|nr:HNH endonuclease [Cellvibrionales bacterium]
MEAQILRLNIAGQPVEWVHWQTAVTLYVRDVVAWSLGDTVRRVRGGVNRASGQQTVIALPSIIASNGERLARPRTTYPLNNKTLFARDGHLCMYCGGPFAESELTRDHILPLSRGGTDIWENVVASCRRCNQHKGNRLLADTALELLATPYRPNLAEYLALLNDRRIRADQMEFLRSQFSKNYRALN